MCEELSSLSSNFSRLRKLAKDDGQRKEKEVQDLIILAEKSKTRYNSLCSDLEKLRNSDQSQKKITLQGRKTGSQQEEDLIKKIQSADQDYSAKAYASQRAKNDMIKIHRPKLSQKLKNLILELDNALQLQLQKYAAYNESLIIGMGNQIIPLDGNRASMRLISSSVDVEKSLYDYLRGAKIENKSSFIPIEYQKHILFGGGKTPKQRNVPNSFSNNSRLVSNSSTVSSIAAPSTTNVIPQTYVPPSSTTATATTTTTPGMPSSNGNLSNTASVPQPPPLGPTPAYSTLDPARPSTLTGPRALDSPTTTYPEQLVPGDEYAAAALPTTEEVITTSTKGQLFGQPIENVPHDDEMVPYFVKKCISLIETYGINSEGIYRSSPNKLKLEELKQQIDLNPNNLSILDPPDLNNITDDYIFIIASLLKNFFAELPNPLLTNEQSPNFIKCGLIEDLKTMHIQLHRIVFELPDANYFTLRDLLFHFANLNNIPKIRMNVKNLSIVWGNNLLGCEFTTKEELSVQCRVIEELISAAQDIFNPKDE
ncbi:hypothetical protein CANARDRAFT_176867 [[Candida] arabinofermentans NRRL YB-2248]|uniref:Rho-GAP domain-containing protein n=1 Tax=[Candida] arabinofermentans NRRL YB-2248 TaxID=983967 RepID=A0A1E4SYT0_9ASCO|nr:hypothetical protein CANARDRAFT_176867 [[Candida] arabinofermentans NRRL YB-2248]